MRRSVVVLSCALGLVGCVGDTPTDKVDSGTTPDAGSDTSINDAASDTSTAVFSIGGNVHFLQPSGGDAGTGLVLTNNGGDPVTVTASGAFTFPTKAATYDVAVKTNPPGQVCSVRGATGKGSATANVTTIVVGCTVAMQSSGGTTTFTTTSKTAVAIAGVNPIPFTTDIASKALVTLMMPSVGLNNGSYDDVATAISLDGNVVASGQWGNQNNVGQGAHTIYAVVDVPAGTHSLTSTWHTVFNFGANTATSYAPFPTQLDLVVLDSLSTYTSAAHGVGTANLTTTSSTMAPIMADVAFSMSAAAPVLALFQAPLTVTGNGTASIFSSTYNLSADSTLISTGRVNATTQDAAPLLVALPTVSIGAHALKASWANPNNAAPAATSKTATIMDAIAFTPAAKTATSQVSGDKTTSSSSFTSISGLAPLTITPTTATQALVIMHVDAAAGGSDKYAGGEFTVALDNVGVGGGVGAITSSFPLAGYPLTFIQLVPVAAGSHTLQAQFRATNLDLHTGAGITNLTAIVIE